MISLQRGSETNPSMSKTESSEPHPALTGAATNNEESNPPAESQTHENLERELKELKLAQSLLSSEKHALEMITEGASVQEILENLCARFDAESLDFISSILLMDPDREHLRFGAGSRVPKEWAQFVSPVKIGPCVGSCGTAAFLKKRVIASDISTDSL